jgi:hypothetical protein
MPAMTRFLFIAFFFAAAAPLAWARPEVVAGDGLGVEGEIQEEGAAESHNTRIHELNREMLIIQEYVRRWNAEKLLEIQAEMFFLLVAATYEKAVPELPYEDPYLLAPLPALE